MANSDLFVCIDHVAYVCPDAEEAVKYYTEVLGWHELHREINDEQGVFEIMVAPAAVIDAQRGHAAQAASLSRQGQGRFLKIAA